MSDEEKHVICQVVNHVSKEVSCHVMSCHVMSCDVTR